jgi:glycosyltransferase involved in cell wall biosynthesis
VRLTGLVEALDHVCCRYRLSAFRRRLAESGHSLDLSVLPHGWWNRLRIGKDAGAADAVVLQRKLISKIEANLLRRHVNHLIFDFDDAVWLRDSYSSGGPRSSRRSRRFNAIVQRCDAIVAGNSFLAEHAQNQARRATVRVIPTCIDVDRYPTATHDRPDGQATLVWIGSSSTLRGLESVGQILERVGQQNAGVRLKLICDRFLSFQHLAVDSIAWREDTEAAQIASSDIGISWVPDDLWSRGKCGLKVLQYMAAGLPVVANSVGVQAELVRHGETGFLVNNEREWVEAVRLLANDAGLRRSLGTAGRRLVEASFGVEAGARMWSSLLGSSHEQRRISA